jgi:hypothetical protein
MIQITVEKQDGRYRRITSRGHAEYDDSGKDLVCAAVSVLLINAVNSLDQLTEDDYSVEEGGKDGGFLSVCFSEPLSEAGTLLLDSLVLGLQSVFENYRETFLNLEIRDSSMN